MPQCCSHHGCEAKHYARGFCKPHYRKLPDQYAKARAYEQTKRTTQARLEQERQRNQRRRGYINAWAEAHKDWAAWWERQRYYEDRRELRRWRPRVWPQCQLKRRPLVRYFVGWYCRSCGGPFVYFTKRAQSPYCATCNVAHHRRSGSRRARQNGARYEVIVPERVFKRDGWRCQLCGVKTTGSCPDPRAPTVDHIVPLSKGGDHLYSNVQCACFECNCLKSDGAANDQLLLIG